MCDGCIDILEDCNKLEHRSIHVSYRNSVHASLLEVEEKLQFSVVPEECDAIIDISYVSTNTAKQKLVCACDRLES